MNPLTDPHLEAARVTVERAIEKHTADYGRLFAHDGKTTISGPDLHARECARILVPVTAAVESAVQVADKAAADVEALRLAPHADPTSALSAADLQDANARAPWVKEDCESLPLADLVERLRAVAAGGSKSSQWLHWRYAKARWKVESDKTPQDAALSMFAETLRDLGVTGPKAGLSSEAQKRAEDAQRLKMFAGSQLRYAQTGVKPGAGGPKINF